MTKKNGQSIKVSNEGKEFLKQMQINRIKLDLETLSYLECLEQIAKYFKNNNNRYIEMITGENKNVK